ncbi:MAG: 6-bladed beta-propeller [candidate division KSB1 bacterium]|nr:6-bladed beta-propeller [candidate division KSB1 bacterium]
MRWRALAWVLLAAMGVVVGCGRREPQRPSVAEYAKRLKPLLEAAPKSVIELDALEPEVIYPDLVIPRDTTQKEGGLFLAAPSGVVVLRDSVYITDWMNHCIMVADMEGRLDRAIGRRGQGPGEFDTPVGIAANSASLLVAEFGNRRVQVFDHALAYLGSIPAGFYLGRPAGIGASDRRFFIPGGLVQDSLLAIYEACRPYRRIGSLMPPVASSPAYANALRQVQAASNAAGLLAVAYSVLPYVFVFDSEARQVATIEFRGREVRELDEKPKGVEFRGTGPTVWTRGFIWGLSVLTDGTLLVNVPKKTLILRQGRHGYEVQRCVHLEGTEGPWAWWYHNGKVYTSSRDGTRILVYSLG